MKNGGGRRPKHNSIRVSTAKVGRSPKKFLVQRISKLVKQFPGYASIRKVAVAREKWTIDNGLITPTLKLKRNVIFQKYASAINDMYKGHVL